jgi:hypothetical protein
MGSTHRVSHRLKAGLHWLGAAQWTASFSNAKTVSSGTTVHWDLTTKVGAATKVQRHVAVRSALNVL